LLRLFRFLETKSASSHKTINAISEMAFEFACKFVHLLPDDKTISEVLAAVWTHDVIEDCRQSYSDVKKALGESVAEIVYALTNEKGKNTKKTNNIPRKKTLKHMTPV
jgi:(p)ppGpp synthase/HD superfamily hydrolase